MLLSQAAIAVESYRVGSDRPGAFGDEILIEGWFLANATIRTMSVRFDNGIELEVHDRERHSDELALHYGTIFGNETTRCRFFLAEPVGIRTWNFPSAVFQVEFWDGANMSWPLKSLFQHVKESNFSAEEAELIMSFESLGDNCEFGLVQRLIGRERLSLLRYAGVGDVFALARGIAGGLAIFNEPDCIDVSHHAHEWVAGVPALQLSFHTGRNVSNNSLEQVKHDENRKLTYLAQKFIEDCETADKVFVYRVHRDVRGGP